MVLMRHVSAQMQDTIIRLINTKQKLLRKSHYVILLVSIIRQELNVAYIMGIISPEQLYLKKLYLLPELWQTWQDTELQP